jgi:hypothetical protein
LAERYRQTLPKEYIHLIKVLSEFGRETGLGKESMMGGDKSPLIVELDGLVMGIIIDYDKFYTDFIVSEFLDNRTTNIIN